MDEKLEFFIDDTPEEEIELSEEEKAKAKLEAEQAEEDGNSAEEEEEEQETIINSEESAEDEEYVKGIFEYLKEQKVINTPEDFEFKATEEGLQEAIEKSKELERASLYDSLYDEMPEEGKKLVEYFKNGGTDVNEFIQTYQEPDFEQISVEDEEVAKAILYNLYTKTTRFSEEKILKEIKRIADGGQILESAEEARQELVGIQKDERDALNAKAAKQLEENEKRLKEAKQEISSLLKTKEVLGVEIEDKEAKALEASIFTPVKTEDGITTSLMQRLQTALSNPEELLILAKLAKEDFKIDFLVPRAKQQAGKKLSKDLKALQARKLSKQKKESQHAKLDASSGPITLG